LFATIQHLPRTEEPIVRLILDGTVVRVRLDRKATSISLLVGLGRARGWPDRKFLPNRRSRPVKK
jgi:hypothetical protein